MPLASGTNEFVLRVTGGNDLWSALSARLVVAEAPRPLIGGLGGVLGFEQGHFTFRVGGVPGQVVVLEASDNLIDWKALGTNVLESAPWEFMDPESGSLPRRFYRARLP